jgi:hypothetical protein
MDYLGAVLIGIFIILGAIALRYAGLGIYLYRENRVERAEDETVEWQAFKDAFEVKK